mgnify:CR=1 FL=1
MTRLKERYNNEVVPKLKKDLGRENPWALPRLEKVVINMGVGKALENRKRLEAAAKDLAAITGQKPVLTKARTSISAFKLREGQEIGCKVTLRGSRMYEFLDRLINVAIPRIKDFRGLPVKGFDSHGNYTMGMGDQFVFPEIVPDQVEFPQGMNITVVFKNGQKGASHRLLEHLGMPFQR